jgi:hypothetical protein
MIQFNDFRNKNLEFIFEKLSASNLTKHWINDFVNSDDPKFAGKSKKQRIKMALGAKYATMRKMSEVEKE